MADTAGGTAGGSASASAPASAGAVGAPATEAAEEPYYNYQWSVHSGALDLLEQTTKFSARSLPEVPSWEWVPV
jgi:hypothetical protein